MRWAVVFAGIGGAITVAMGAWAAHGGGGGEIARGWLSTGAQYGLWHSLALLAVAAIAARAPGSRLLTAGAVLFAAGIVLFSFSLFARALFGWTWIAPATPVGGISFIAGWLVLAAYGVSLYVRNGSTRP